MFGLRVEATLLLLGLTGTLLLGSGRGSERSNETRPFELSDSASRDESRDVVAAGVEEEAEDAGDDYYDEDSYPEYPVSEGEGVATIEDYGLFDEQRFEVEAEDSEPKDGVSGPKDGVRGPIDGVSGPKDGVSGPKDGVSGPKDGVSGPKDGLQLESEAAPRWTSSITQASDLKAGCNDAGFLITLLTGTLSDVKVLGSKDLVSVSDAPASCGYEADFLHHTLSVPFTGCNVKRTNSYSLQLLYDDEFGQTKVSTASCEEKRAKFDPSQFLRSGDRPSPKCPLKSTPQPTPAAGSSKTSTESESEFHLKELNDCAVDTGERLACGQAGISSSDCEMMGCCVDPNASSCFYPLDECTADQQFVFAIRYNSASIPVDPTKLVIPGSPSCKPAIVNDKVAIFKFNVTDCGTHAYEVGETNIYLAEVQTAVEALNLKYGIITRSDPLRFMVECRYSKSSRARHRQSLISVGYMVKIPPSSLQSVLANGLYGVQLRIAKDDLYSSYHPTTSRPLRLLLGTPVYLELNLKSPKPNAVILVNYCVAYPRSARNALVLVYEGCANPYDPNVFVLQVSDFPINRHRRRFVVKAFQFMDQKTNKYLDEEIYFMCSSEVCRPTEKTCQERCFDGKVIL
ncbi:zona pellucida sperm-binding protein 1-like [Brachionichthys hirsutus]|uniref:zona pellucida sperm-binding protein 1-like n=1 Tax=Brachionichthys hirsutus TaxID=412623 RepID=UPI00360487A9